jgi:hypothetical protein
MEAIKVAEAIQRCIEKISKVRTKLPERAKAMAEAVSAYDRRLAIVLIELKNGKTLELDGQMIQNPPVGTTKEIAKGLCWKERLDKEQAEAMWRAANSNLNALLAEQNGYQSINRHLDSI